jgi:hypothetical protein
MVAIHCHTLQRGSRGYQLATGERLDWSPNHCENHRNGTKQLGSLTGINILACELAINSLWASGQPTECET